MTWRGWILCALLAGSSVGQAADLFSIGPNNEGIKGLKEGNSLHAFQNLVEALNEDPFNPVIRLNLGLAYAENKEPEKALKEYATAAELAEQQPELKFYAYFNSGVLLGEGGNIDGALEAYQKALDINPASQEAKTNIELLWKQNQQKKGGGGKGDQKDKPKQDQKDDSEGGGKKDQEKQQDQGQDEKKEEPKNKQPKPFESQELTPDTVRKILEELKSQEQRVRAEDYARGAKEMPREKDW